MRLWSSARFLLGCGRRFTRAGVAKDEQPPLFVGDVDVAACIYQTILSLAYELIVWGRHSAHGWSRRDKPSRFRRQTRVLDVEDSQTGVEVGEVNQIALLLHVRIVLQDIRVVRPEAAAFVAKIGVRRVLGRRGRRKGRYEFRFCRIFYVDQAGQEQRYLAGKSAIRSVATSSALRMGEQQIPARNRHHIVHGDIRTEGRADSQLADHLWF